MKTVTLEVRSLEATLADFGTALDTGAASEARIAFATPGLLFQTLTQKRWELLAALQGAGPQSIRGAARLVGRDVKAVHGDVHALLDTGLLERTAGGKIVFRYDQIHVDFVLRVA